MLGEHYVNRSRTSRMIDVSTGISNVLSTNFVCLSQKNPRISKNIYGLTISYTGFVQSRIVLSHSTCVVKIHVPMMFCKIHDVAEAARRRGSRNEVREGCH